MPTRVFVTAAALLASLIVVGWLTFATGRYEEMVFGTCTVFTIVALGLPTLMSRIESRRADANRLFARTGKSRRTFYIFTGRLSMREAKAQILLVPVSLALAFSAIAIVEALVRHSL